MPRPTKSARLWLRKARSGKDGRILSQATWIILDGGKHFATGCLEREIERAEECLAEHISSKYQPARVERELEEIDLADVLMIYMDHMLPVIREREGVTPEAEDKARAVRRFKATMGRLNGFWGGKTLSEVTGSTCRAFVKHRKRIGGARRDLQDLSAAIGHHHKEGFHRGVVRVVLPEKGKARERWLTRDEAAHLLWVCWKTREFQIHGGVRIKTDKYPLRHLARFILIGLYTGTRAGAIATASPRPSVGRSYVDLERGIYYRLAAGRKETNKRQPPAPIPPRLLAHMRRWKVGEHFVEWNGAPVKSVKTAFASAVEKAGIEHATPHTLRHTAATWLMQAGVSVWDAAGFLGMSEKVLRETYGHHSPEHLKGAAHRIGYRPTPDETLVVSLAKARNRKLAADKVAGDNGSELSVKGIGGPGGTRTPNQTVMSGLGSCKSPEKSAKSESK